MSMNEINGWSKYLAQEPSNSIEIQLALISQQIAAFGGAKNTKLKDFLITQVQPDKFKKEPVSKNQILSVFGSI